MHKNMINSLHESKIAEIMNIRDFTGVIYQIYQLMFKLKKLKEENFVTLSSGTYHPTEHAEDIAGSCFWSTLLAVVFLSFRQCCNC